LPYPFFQVDAFTRRPLHGNPAAVVFDADEIPSEVMQKIAQEMNLSETVFLLRPTDPSADYRVRIFTPRNELPFAGHPTIAAAHSVLERSPALRGKTLLRQQCALGLIPVEVLSTPGGGRLLTMTQGAPSFRPSELAPAEVARMLGCSERALAGTPMEVVSTGVPWLIVELAGIAELSALDPDQGLVARSCRSLGAAGITVFAERGDAGAVRIRLRTFAPGEGIAEDPVCGSGNGSVAAWLARHRHPEDATGGYRAEQGVEIGRDGEVHASWDRGPDGLRIRIGGEAAIVARGELLL